MDERVLKEHTAEQKAFAERKLMADVRREGFDNGKSFGFKCGVITGLGFGTTIGILLVRLTTWLGATNGG